MYFLDTDYLGIYTICGHRSKIKKFKKYSLQRLHEIPHKISCNINNMH